MKHYTLVLITSLLITLSCCVEKPSSPLSDRSQKVEQKARAFFKTFADRNDWDTFCSFYREDMTFSDIMLQLELDSLWQFKRFYNWDGEGDNFRKLTPDQEHVTIESLVVNDSTAVMTGHFNPFYYYDELIEPETGMAATIWLFFDENLKIKRQIDWIEYDLDVLQNVIDRVKENGMQEVPDWLDLSQDK